ncbi:MAG: hypothetical protein K8S20_13260 [Chloroflexi bacterium]|nr:hypothetical protein [Chloroflexota bacterium]
MKYPKEILLSGGVAWVLWRACGEFYQIAWGSGVWIGEFSRTWLLLYCVFVCICAGILVLSSVIIWRPDLLAKHINRILSVREKLGVFRWVIWLAIFSVPVWFFQFTLWGLVLQKFYIRILVWIIVVCLLAILASKNDRLADWKQLLSMLILTSSLFSIFSSFKLVNDYPFSLGWSEGNRLWDYSVMFARDRYIFPMDSRIPVFLDFGRQLIGGLPFLIPGITIGPVRLWVALTQVLPYLLLGFVLFRARTRGDLSWLLLPLWAYLFLKQGPIHPPLVVCAIMVALAWRSPLWFAIPLVIGAGYFAQASRYTWMFAPGMWIFMLEVVSASFPDRKTALPIFKRAILLGVLGIFGGLYLGGMLPESWDFISRAAVSIPSFSSTPSGAEAVPAVTPAQDGAEVTYPPFIQFVIDKLNIQPLLWYRLLPNATYGNGIVLALLFAVSPLVFILLYVSAKNIWQINLFQKISILLPLLAFLIVGLVASTKIGGGGDLHNMDMFLIGLFFMGVVAWNNEAGNWILNGAVPGLIKGVIVLALVNSAVVPLQSMRTYGFTEDTASIKTLVDAPSEKALDLLPSPQKIDFALQIIQAEVRAAKPNGDVLFMDQRQLLTFGYIKDVPLIADYDKKLLMDQALSSDSNYFNNFYADISTRRFSLIVSELLRTPVKDSTYQFGEENNAWVKWVSNPLLCYYEPKVTLKEVGVQLLVPKNGPVDCSAQMP